jgi:hypothetical protein
MTFSSLLLTSALLMPAQRPLEAPQTTRPAINEPSSGAAPSAMAQDVEILRRILAAKLHSGGGNPVNYRTVTTANGVSQYMPSSNESSLWRGSSDGQHSWGYGGGSVDGVYLPGYGVVLMATVSGSRRDGKPADDKPAPKPMSDWDRAQAELRGEKPVLPPAAASRPPSVRDTVLRVLADNGHHLSRLRDDEKVTVVVTFRDGDMFFAPMSTTFGQTSNPFQGLQGQNTLTPAGGGGGLSATLQGTQPSSSNKQPSSGHDYEMLADLHLKQGQYQSAAEAYKKAIGAYENELKADRPADYQMALSKLLARQAQAQIGLGHNDEAAELLSQAKSADGKYTPRTSDTTGSKPRVPAKMIISATRRQLGAIAAGQMSFDEFRRAASVEDE